MNHKATDKWSCANYILKKTPFCNEFYVNYYPDSVSGWQPKTMWSVSWLFQKWITAFDKHPISVNNANHIHAECQAMIRSSVACCGF